MSNKIIKDSDRNKSKKSSAKKSSIDDELSMKKYIMPTLVGLLVVGVIIAILIIAPKMAEDEKDKGEQKDTQAAVDISGKHIADIVIENYGTITVELDADAAPITVANFIKLANEGFYDGLTFHRIIEGFMMQGGAPKDAYSQAATIKGEFSSNGYKNDLKHTRGAISMARTSVPDSASSQFFIMHKDAAHLDGEYAAFGYVKEGMDIVDKICEESEPTDDNGSISKDKQPVIKTITIRK